MLQFEKVEPELSEQVSKKKSIYTDLKAAISSMWEAGTKDFWQFSVNKAKLKPQTVNLATAYKKFGQLRLFSKSWKCKE